MTTCTAAPRKSRAGWQPGADLYAEIDVDNFAGGGGVAMGFEDATGKAFDEAINHDPSAIEMHAINHPGTRHHCESVWKIDALQVCAGRAVRLGWFSPDCTQFSRAKGDTPIQKNIRCLAWVVTKWARLPAPHKPRVIMLENVREFTDWGPLIHKAAPAGGWLWRVSWPKVKGKKRVKAETITGPHRDQWDQVRALRRLKRESGATKVEPWLTADPTRKGETFKRWAAGLVKRGYVLEWRVLDAADYGAPTHRKRLFLIARRDGNPIAWPAKTHGARGSGLKPFRTASKCIDWSIECPSIFDREARGKKPLAANTCKRIARGVGRFVLDTARPFIVPINHGDNWKNGGDRARSVDRPAPTVTGSRGEYTCAPTFVQTGYGERPGQAPRTMPVDEPIGTIVGSGKHAVASAVLKAYGGVVGHDVHRPLGTVTAKDHHWIGSATLVGVGGRSGQSPPRSVDAPLGTTTAKADRAVVEANLVRIGQQGGNGDYTRDPRAPLTTIVSKAEHCASAATMVRMNHGEKQWNAPTEPLVTITSQGNKAGVAIASMIEFYGTNKAGRDPRRPGGTVTGQGQHHGISLAVLTRYYSSGGQLSRADAPLHTIRTGDCHAAVEARAVQSDVLIDAELAMGLRVGAFLEEYGGPEVARLLTVLQVQTEHGLVTLGKIALVKRRGGIVWLLIDLGLRMLRPRELARCQGFPDSYVLTGSQANQVAKIGNSVPPQVVSALVRANLCAVPARVAA